MFGSLFALYCVAFYGRWR